MIANEITIQLVKMTWIYAIIVLQQWATPTIQISKPMAYIMSIQLTKKIQQTGTMIESKNPNQGHFFLQSVNTFVMDNINHLS